MYRGVEGIPDTGGVPVPDAIGGFEPLLSIPCGGFVPAMPVSIGGFAADGEGFTGITGFSLLYTGTVTFFPERMIV